MDNELMHYGVPGMRWGHRKRSGSLISRMYRKHKRKVNAKKAQERAEKRAEQERQKNRDLSRRPTHSELSSMSDAEIEAKIQRIKLEKNYVDLVKQTDPVKKGNKYVDALRTGTTNAISDATKDIGAQVLKHILAAGVNSIAGYEMVSATKQDKKKKEKNDSGDD